MNTYFSTFIPGLGEVVKNQLSKDLHDFSTNLLYDGLIVYRSNSPIQKVKELKYLNNSFLLLKEFKNLPSKEPLKFMAKQILDKNLGSAPLSGKTFRIMFYFANKPVSIQKDLLVKLEEKLASRYKQTIDRSNPNQEFWFLYRKEGLGLFGFRLTKHPDYKKILTKGQLRPELANLLCLVSQPKESDVVLDPFAGSGSIAIERKRFPYTKVISGDIKTTNLEIKRLDVLKMAGVKPESIDKIITDPPWGISVGKELDLPDFYSKMLDKFSLVLKPKGSAVILIGNKVVFEEVLNNANKLNLTKKYDILVSGKKAAIYKLTRA